jgi:hypothetical protein
MKLKNEVKTVSEKYQQRKTDIETYAKELKQTGGYKDFETRLAHDIIKGIMGTTYICDLYDKYGCHDPHIKTLSIQALKKADIEY